jgi:Flp pilus assembly protein TadG
MNVGAGTAGRLILPTGSADIAGSRRICRTGEWIRTRLRRDERGAAAVELTLMIPALVLVLGLLVAGGRLWFARTTVVEAAQTAARAASLARTAGQAYHDGQGAAAASLATAGLTCGDRAVVIGTGAFGVPAGTPATVTSVVECSVPFADILLPGMPGAIRLSSRGAAALDTYRSRS